MLDAAVTVPAACAQDASRYRPGTLRLSVVKTCRANGRRYRYFSKAQYRAEGRSTTFRVTFETCPARK